MNQEGSPLYRQVSLDREYLAGKILDRYAEVHKKTWGNFSPRRREQIREEIYAVVQSLQESLATGSPAFLIDFTCRQQSRLISQHFPSEFVVSYLGVFCEVIAQELSPDYRKNADVFIRKAVSALKPGPEGTGPCAHHKLSLSPPARSFLDAALTADPAQGEAIIDKALSSGMKVHDIYTGIFQPVLAETGRLWQENEASIAQEHYISGFIRRIMNRIHDSTIATGRTKLKRKTVVAACVGEELHEIGIRMVADFFERDGWDVYFIGANTPTKCILAAVAEQKADVVALSITMPARLPDIQYLIRSFRADPDMAKVKIIVGGYPFGVIPDLWKQVGADAGAVSADEAVAAAHRLTAGNRQA
ncbi:cobalamin-dependent protein [uncultured Methanoregula sp.]|uniref:cobalamin B12-binding domain-containing protein n=1 Tax=uncultured Methanoregula sp. TaxID=1005933 RepID=UPI002AAB405D|nr:cobalamin-dependent protein [uncultured Methanoregula sp.]